MMDRQNNAAFTLIELLVVVTIIVVLLALLTPAIDRAMTAAASAVCEANLHEWGVATRQYSLDYKGKRVGFKTEIRNYWWNPLAPYVGEPDFKQRPLGTLVLKANLCPEAPMRPGEGMDVPGTVSATVPVPGGPVTYTTGSKWGSAHKAWEWGASSVSGGPPLADTSFGSYGMNLWVADVTDQNSYYEGDNFFGRYANVPGDTPLFGDCNWVGSWPQGDERQPSGDLPPSDTENGNASGDSSWAVGGLMGRFVLNRHGLGNMAINLGYVDCSAQNVRLGDLWMQPWHKNFKKTDAYHNDYP